MNKQAQFEDSNTKRSKYIPKSDYEKRMEKNKELYYKRMEKFTEQKNKLTFELEKQGKTDLKSINKELENISLNKLEIFLPKKQLKRKKLDERDELIYNLFLHGKTKQELAEIYKIKKQRIGQIIFDYKQKKGLN